MKKRRIWRYMLIALLLITAVIYWFPGPEKPFSEPACTVLFDRYGELIGARIARDGQWRFPAMASVPEKFEQAILLFEDKHFYYHPGVNPFSLARAAYQNIRQGRIVSGGSTLTMQVVRLSRRGKPRTIPQKLLEIILAMKLEMRESKQDILALYASNAPFGGNVVGLEAAAWRYFGLPSHKLSWAESAMLAVLPNAPALIHPGRNRMLLKEKRDRLLIRLRNSGEIDSLTCQLAMQESLPKEPLPLPGVAPHLLDRVYEEKQGELIISTLDGHLQEKVTGIITRYNKTYSLNGIHNAAALVMEVNNGEVLAYTGNVPGKGHANDVDVIRSLRSPGSLLKPILFAAMLEEGAILTNTLLPDIPTIISGYSPKNYNRAYEGAIPAQRALEKSLNVPAVRMLQDYKYERLYHLLEKLGITSLSNPPDHYGLSLILGGAEMSLWELCGMYASLARTLNHYYPYDGRYDQKDIRPPVFDLEVSGIEKIFTPDPPLSAGAIYLTFQALLEVNRPEQEAGWEFFTSSKQIAWKTGTSFGFRDGWAIGTTPGHVVGVWVGNADGEGRPGLTGISTAAPILFEIFNSITGRGWFDMPYDELREVAVCRKSGYLKTGLCAEVDTIWVLPSGLNTLPCPYHHLINTDKNERFRVNSSCMDPSVMRSSSWFVLPPVMEWYYKMKDPSYRELPPYKMGCRPDIDIPVMQFIYPENGSHIFIPMELDGIAGDAIAELAHRNKQLKVFWHLDGEFLGVTQYTHQMAIRPEKGKHHLRTVDENGNEAVVVFTVEGDKEK